MYLSHKNRNHTKRLLSCLFIATICFTLSGCNISIGGFGSNSNTPNTSCQSNCTLSAVTQGLRLYIEPDDGEHVITDAIRGAHQSVWLEIYLLSDTNVIYALEDDANNGIDVRVMLEPHPYGVGTSSVTRTMDELHAAGVKTQYTSPTFALTHEKGMIIDGTTAYVMTSNFTRSALGGYRTGTENREYGIIDSNTQDVQAVTAIFQADWNHSQAQFNDPNLVVSPINSRNDFTTLIGSARHTLLIEAEEMDDSAIESALVSAAQHGVQVEVILPSSSLSSSTNQGIATIKQGGVQVREDPRLYMHAKIMIVDGSDAFVGSENISTQSLDQNRELGIIVADTSVLSRLESTFQSDWNDSHSA